MRAVSERRSYTAIVFHTACFVWYAHVWLWHFSDAAAGLPGAVGFGWFFKFLTFWSFTLQAVQLALGATEGVLHQGKHTRLTTVVDDLSCALFGMAHVVTIMFHVLEATTGNVAIPAKRPFWLDWSVHKLNVVIAWGDLLLARPRTFSRRAEVLSAALAISYTIWILVCQRKNGEFPYPFLNNMPFPSGFVLIVICSVTVFGGLFRLGLFLNMGLRQLCVSAQLADADDFVAEFEMEVAEGGSTQAKAKAC